ncbi:hypothetical protein GCM10020229_26640 [Kitasatospora albolonga]
MTSLLRAKYDQHPGLAEILLATGDATVIYDDMDSEYWGDNTGRGRNWVGAAPRTRALGAPVAAFGDPRGVRPGGLAGPHHRTGMLRATRRR